VAKKRALRIAAIFFAVMLTLTFCSRAIYRSTLPHVQAQRPIGGTQTWQYVIRDFTVAGERELYEYIPCELPRALTVKKLLVLPGETVEAGDALAEFYPPGGEMALLAAQEAYFAAVMAAEVWVRNYENQYDALEARMENARTPEERESIRKDIELLQNGILNGTSAKDVQGRVDEAREAMEYLERLKRQNWQYCAANSGVVCSFGVQVGSMYSGISEIALLADASHQVSLKAQWPSLPKMGNGNWKWTVEFYAGQLRLGEGSVRDDGEMAAFSLPEDVEPAEVNEIQITLESPYERALIPMDAVEGNAVFLLQTEVGDWGQTVYVAKRTEFEAGNNDGRYVVILNGISTSDRIIVRNSQPLMDGQQVLLEGYKE